jgi:hypothetical protein
MARRRARAATETDADLILESANESTLLDMLDELLNKGVVLNGDVVLGVAGVDLVYLKLSSLLCAIDRIQSAHSGKKRRHNRGPRRLRKSR